MAEVKKSWFLALDSSDPAASITGLTALAPVTAVADDRSAFVLEPSGLPDLSLDYEEVTRDVIRDSYLPAVPLRGIINTTGSMTFELHGGGINTTIIKLPDYHPMLKSAFGSSTYNDQDAAASPGYTDEAVGEELTFNNTVPGMGVGSCAVWSCDAATSGKLYLITYVTVSAGAASKQLVMYFGDANGGAVGAIHGTPNWNLISSVSYTMPASLSSIESFGVAYYRGNIVRELYAKCTASSVEFPFTAGELILPVFNFNVGDGTVESRAYYDVTTGNYDSADNTFAANELLTSDAVGTILLSSTNATPLFAKAVDWKFEYADVVNDYTAASWTQFSSKIVDSFTLTLNNETSVKKDITAAEGIHSYGVQGRSVELALSAYYDDSAGDFSENLTDLFQDPQNKYRIRVSALSGSQAGNRVFLFAPRMSFKPTVTEDTGLFKYDVTGSAERDDIFGENALSLVFF